jgi:AICAR transformylase/IMP cyclohydrolase PurH
MPRTGAPRDARRHQCRYSRRVADGKSFSATTASPDQGLTATFYDAATHSFSTRVTDWPLKYGLNPHQADAVASFPDGRPWLRVLNGRVGYINLLDALRAWTLARELGTTLGAPSAASIKHVHPAGAAIAGPLTPSFRIANGLGGAEFSGANRLLNR